MLPSPGHTGSPWIEQYDTAGLPGEANSCAIDPPGLSQTMQLVSVGEEDHQQYTPPPSFAEFFNILQLIRIGEEFFQQATPPPYAAKFPEIVQFLRIGEESWQDTPPPLSALYEEEFPEIVQLASIGEEL